MYNKNENKKTDFQAIIENKTVISFNTDKKRKNFIKALNNSRTITCITNVSYPWSLEKGMHNAY